MNKEFKNIDHDLGFNQDGKEFYITVNEYELEQYKKGEKEFFSILVVCLTPQEDETEFPEERIKKILEKVGVFNPSLLLLIQEKEYKKDWGDAHALFHVRERFDIDLLPRDDEAWGREE